MCIRDRDKELKEILEIKPPSQADGIILGEKNGSVATIDKELMDAANMIEGEKVQVLDVDNGERLETYIIKGGGKCNCYTAAFRSGGNRRRRSADYSDNGILYSCYAS